jgi:MinD-like ATPase involved in chromosome partitioning or flagellar assembly
MGLGMKPKRVVFPIAGKGGVGKTTVMATLAEWYVDNACTAELFDMDPDNKAEGSLKALFPRAHKLPALESWAYDKLLGVSLESSADVILADMGAAQGHRMIPWFREFYRVMQESGLELRWTALGVVDGDIASARSVIEWGEELQGAVDYVVVHNHYQEGAPSAWENPKLSNDVAAFRDAFSPVEIRIDARRPDLQKMMRTMNVTLGDVGERRTAVPELRAPDMTLRARTYRFRAFSQFTEARRVLLP